MLSVDRFKRAMLLAIIALSLLSTAIGWGAIYARGLPVPALNWVQGITVCFLAALLVTAWFEWIPQLAVEWSCLLYAGSVCAACMALHMYWPLHATGIRLQALYLWIPVVYVFAFALTDHRRGLFVSLGIWVLFAGISLPYLLHHVAGEYGNFTLQLHFVSAVLIAALYFFSSYQYRLGLAQRTVGELAQLSNTDDLTLLSNRRHMAAIIVDELDRCTSPACEFAVMFFDVDHFKIVNDERGHGTGDKVLAALAARASQIFRFTDSLGRWGGDEFVAVVRNVDAEAAANMAEALRRDIDIEPLLDNCHVTISCGVTLARAGDSIDSLLQRTDVALYAAKRAGRNQVKSIMPGAA